jgi:hypothetical protein
MGEDVSRADGAQTAMAGAPMVSAAVIEDRFDQVLADFQTAMLDETAARRLGRIGFTAVIRVREADHLELWCLFNDTAEVRDSGGGELADIEVVIPAALLEDFWSRHLALEMLEGRVTFTGKVRKLLQMMPVIRAAVLRSQSTEVPS